MVREITKDIFFLGQKSEPATEADIQTGRDLQDTLKAHRAECVGMAANMIGIKKNVIIVNMGIVDLVMFNPVLLKIVLMVLIMINLIILRLLQSAVKKTLVLLAVLQLDVYSIRAIIFMTRMKANVSATA